MLPLDTIICGDNVAVLKTFPDACIDLTVTSPPYDNLRKYNGFTFDFEGVAQELWRVTKQGGVVVWVVGDATVKGSETGTSFRQALHFMETGFNLHDTMIYEKVCQSMAGSLKCYVQAFEYMFVMAKGAIGTVNILRDRPNKEAGKVKNPRRRNADGTMKPKKDWTIPQYGRRFNIWAYGHGGANHGHPAIFPEDLARDHILSWSNPGDAVLDPFIGSGTTAKMALLNGRRYIGIDVSEEYCAIASQRIESVQTQARFAL
jgi:DNA modification methylase